MHLIHPNYCQITSTCAHSVIAAALNKLCVYVHVYVCFKLPCILYFLDSHYLFAISHPNKSGIPSTDLTGDIDEGQLAAYSTPVQKAICRVALKAFAHYGVSVNINEKIYGRFKVKLWQMGQLLNKHRGGNQRSAILKRWETEQWELLLDRCDLHEETIQGIKMIN